MAVPAEALAEAVAVPAEAEAEAVAELAVPAEAVAELAVPAVQRPQSPWQCHPHRPR